MDRRTFLRRSALVGSGAVVGAVATDGIERLRADLVTPEAWGSTIASAPARGQLRVWWSAPEAGDGPRRMALTFDDGPTEQLTARVLDVLAAHRVPATFFMIGELARRHPDLVRRVRDGGHEIANHSDDHLSAARTDADGVRTSLARAAETLEQLGGRRPRWYRPPRGEVTTATLLAAGAEGHDLALWSLERSGSDDGHAVGGADDDAAGVRQHLTGRVHPGAVVDLHDGIGRSAWVGLPNSGLVTRRETEVSVLAQVLQSWQDAGYTLVRLSELIPG